MAIGGFNVGMRGYVASATRVAELGITLINAIGRMNK